MSAAIGACLARLHTETLTRAVNACLPEIAGVDARVNAFVEGLLTRYRPMLGGNNPPHEDLVPLKRIYQDSHLSPLQRSKIFAICIRVGISNFSDPILKLAIAEQTALFIPLAIRLSIIGVIEMLSPKDCTPKTLNALLIIFEEVTSKKEQKEIVNAIEQMPSEQRGDAIVQAASIVKGVSDGGERACLLEGVGLLPGHMRTSVVSLASYFVKRLGQGCDRAYMLQVIAEIKPELREKVVSLALPFMEDITDKLELRGILKAIAELLLLKPGFGDSIDLALTLTEGISDNSQRAEVRRNLLFIMGILPFEDLTKATLLALITLYQGMAARNEVIDVCVAVQQCPKEERAAVVLLASHFIKETTKPEDRILFLRSIKEIPAKNREAVVTAARPFMEGIADPFDQVGNLKIIERYLPTRHAASLPLTLSWMEGNANGRERFAALEKIALLIEAGHKDSISLALMLTAGMADAKKRTALLQTMLSAIYMIPVGARTQAAVEAIIYFFEDITDEAEQKELLKQINSCQEDRRAYVVIAAWRERIKDSVQ